MTGIYFLPVRPVEREASSLFAALRRSGQASWPISLRSAPVSPDTSALRRRPLRLCGDGPCGVGRSPRHDPRIWPEIHAWVDWLMARTPEGSVRDSIGAA